MHTDDHLENVVRWARLVDSTGRVHDRCEYKYGERLELGPVRGGPYSQLKIELLDDREQMVVTFVLAEIHDGQLATIAGL